jgi:DNA-binding NarL/FixJ family response regulator
VRAGVIGYLPKTTDANTLRRAIRAAAAGQIQLSPEAQLHLLREVRAPDHVQPLTIRETDVLRLMVAGMANKEIAHNLIIGETTVKSHVRHILGKFGVESRTQAALHAIRTGSVVEESKGIAGYNSSNPLSPWQDSPIDFHLPFDSPR